ncbi:hypothetical protein [Microlunatus flavus]|uniref:Uncharacterized protein n=1 Tax=Microlunatus flavus TaxID=1036181 RepID=A0A1H9APG3_9ACTN|nr:hypothetical protein [Microlunatus flavus]SEP78263.1 hypothetical protein SAMN05421756_101673 [Microlunatus flavus]
MLDDPAISDERVAQVLGLYARMAHHVVADPEQWLGLDDEPPEDASIPAKVLDELRDRVFGEETPASPTWEQRPLDERVRWWTRRIGLTAGLAAAVPRVAGALADRIPLQAALGASGAGLAVCAVAREHGVVEAERWVPLLAKVLLDRDLPDRLAADEAAKATDAEAEARLRTVPPHEEEATGLGPAARRGVGTLWRLGRQIWELQSILDERPRGSFLFRAIAQVPVVGVAGGFLDERGGIKRAAKETTQLLEQGGRRSG